MRSEERQIGGQAADIFGNDLYVGGKGEERSKGHSQVVITGLVQEQKAQSDHDVDGNETRKEDEISWGECLKGRIT